MNKRFSATSYTSRTSSSSGFTLIEVLIGIIILGAAISLLSVSIKQSVQQQEKMGALLDIYQVALTVRPEIESEIELGNRNGTIEQNDLVVNWQANVLDEKQETSIFNPEAGSYQSGNRIIYLYNVELMIENNNARRAFSFKHTQKQSDNNRSPFFNIMGN